MTLLVLGLLLFLGTHSVRIYAEGWRSRSINRVGPGTWKLAYSLLSIAGFTLIVLGWQAARTQPLLVWQPPLALKHVAALLTLPAFVLLAAAYVPGNAIKARVGHPMVAGVKTWAFAHLLVNGTLAGLTLFGAFLAWAALDYAAARRRDRQAGVVYSRGPASRTVLTVAAGLVAWALFAFWLHGGLIGVRPFG